MNNKFQHFFRGNLNFHKPNLFCFHHAGGNARVYHDWTKEKDVNIISIELPGRGQRIHEELQTDDVKVTEEIASAIASLYQKNSKKHRFSLFGHSLGAILAFSVAHILIEKYDLHPTCLFVAGRHAPQDIDPSGYHSDMGEEALIEELKLIGETPLELLENEEYCSFAIPIIYKDYKLSESFKATRKKLPIPIIAHFGKNDIDASEKHMNNWQHVTTSNFKTEGFEGGHFFLLNKTLNYSSILSKEMMKIIKDIKPQETEDDQPIILYDRGVIS